MAIAFYHVGRTPGQTQFGLDTFTERFKANTAADTVMISGDAPQRGEAHPDYEFMFVTDLYFSETGESACAIDVVYMGCMKDDGEGGPLLPPQKPSSGGQVASATTNTSSVIYPATATNPATVQFYAITNTLTFISNSPSDSSEPSDPAEITDVITWDLGFGLQPGLSRPDLVTFLLNEAFTQGIIEPQPEIEPIVYGQYWQITKRKTRTLFPYAPDA